MIICIAAFILKTTTASDSMESILWLRLRHGVEMRVKPPLVASIYDVNNIIGFLDPSSLLSVRKLYVLVVRKL